MTLGLLLRIIALVIGAVLLLAIFASLGHIAIVKALVVAFVILCIGTIVP